MEEEGEAEDGLVEFLEVFDGEFPLVVRSEGIQRIFPNVFVRGEGSDVTCPDHPTSDYTVFKIRWREHPEPPEHEPEVQDEDGPYHEPVFEDEYRMEDSDEYST